MSGDGHRDDSGRGVDNLDRMPVGIKIVRDPDGYTPGSYMGMRKANFSS